MSQRSVITNPEVYAAMGRAGRAISDAVAKFRPVVRESRPAGPTRQEFWVAQSVIARALQGDVDRLRAALASLPAGQVRSMGEAAALLVREATAVQEEA